jgi:hypothetical protein
MLNGRPLNDMNVCLDRVHTASYNTNCIGGVMVKSNARLEGGRSWVRAPVESYQRLYKLICVCFSGKHAALSRKSKEWSTLNQDNVSKWGDMSIRRLLF